jgi:hypothetical protein
MTAAGRTAADRSKQSGCPRRFDQLVTLARADCGIRGPGRPADSLKEAGFVQLRVRAFGPNGVDLILSLAGGLIQPR